MLKMCRLAIIFRFWPIKPFHASLSYKPNSFRLFCFHSNVESWWPSLPFDTCLSQCIRCFSPAFGSFFQTHYFFQCFFTKIIIHAPTIPPETNVLILYQSNLKSKLAMMTPSTKIIPNIVIFFIFFAPFDIIRAGRGLRPLPTLALLTFVLPTAMTFARLFWFGLFYKS